MANGLEYFHRKIKKILKLYILVIVLKISYSNIIINE